jgi:hypothetical protein
MSLSELREKRNHLINNLYRINKIIDSLELSNRNYDIYLENNIIYPFNIKKEMISASMEKIKSGKETINSNGINLYEYYDYAESSYIVIRTVTNGYSFIDATNFNIKEYLLNENDLNALLNLF